MSERVPSREELFEKIREAQMRGWPTDGVAEAFMEQCIVSFWLEEFDRCWKSYLCLAAYETTKYLSEQLKLLRENESVIREKGLWEEYKAGEEELNRALAFWSMGDEAKAYEHAKKAEESLRKVVKAIMKEEVKEIAELRDKAQELIASIRQLEIPMLLELDDDLAPIEEKIKEADKLAKEGSYTEAEEKYKEIIKELEELKKQTEEKRKQILVGAGVTAGVATLGLLYAYKKGKLKIPPLKLPGLA